jgi:hypothetical protein
VIFNHETRITRNQFTDLQSAIGNLKSSEAWTTPATLTEKLNLGLRLKATISNSRD